MPTVEYIDNKRFHEELYYSFYGPDGTFTDSVAPGKVWKLRSIKAHLSVAFASIENLKIRISSILGSAYNTVIYSANLSEAQDIFIHYSDPLLFLSGDQLVYELSMVSATNIIGIQIETWAARG